MKAHFIDFDDSFAWNVVQELNSSGFDVNVQHWMDFESLPEADLLVLGPGPGHPDDYQRIFFLIEEWLSEERPFFGLCLGHQIFWRLRGENVYRSKEPLHGQRIDLNLTQDWQEWLHLPPVVKVQRYNSLSVPEEALARNPDLKGLISEGEIMITRGKKILTYQFHPESVGTSFRHAYFRPLSGFFV
ncbi:MAG: aminodeoxychorismate/anthranilate synthase component II [Bacteriovoracaceae bacterium]